MANQIGRKVEAAIGLEDTRGVGVAAAYALGKVGFSLFDKIEEARNEESIGNIGDSRDKYVVEKYAQGEVSGALGANSALYLLALAFGGAPSVGSPSDSVYPWTIAHDNDNVHQSASLLVKDGNKTQLHKFLMLDQLEISIELNDLVRYSAQFMSKVGVTSADSIPTYAEDYKFTKRKAQVKIANDVSGLGAASVLKLKQFNMTISKNLIKDGGFNTVEPEAFYNGETAIEGTLMLNWEDQTYRNYMLNGDRKALRLSLTSEKLIGASAYGSIEIDLPKVDFFGWEPSAENPDLVTQEINFKANVDLTDGMVESVTVNNALSAS